MDASKPLLDDHHSLQGKGAVADEQSEPVAKCGREIHERVTQIVPELQKKFKNASAKLKRAISSQCVELPFDELRFAAIAAILNHPELHAADRQIRSLPAFLSSSVGFVAQLAYLHEKIMGDNFSEDFVAAAVEALINKQKEFRTHAGQIGKELREVTREIEAKCLKSKIVSKTGIVGGAIVGTAGFAAVVAGLALAPFTAGISIGLAGSLLMLGIGATSAAAGGTALGLGIQAHFKEISLQEALSRLTEFEHQAQLIIEEFNKLNAEGGPELIEKLLEQSGLTCPICFDLVSDDCRIVNYDDDEDSHEVYCADCIQKVMALSDNPISPITRKPLKPDMVVRERSLVRRVKALRAQLQEETGVLRRFKEACQMKATLHDEEPSH